MIGFSDVKAVIVGAKKVAIYIKRTPPRIVRILLIVLMIALEVWVAGSWMVIQYLTKENARLIKENERLSEESRNKDKTISVYYNQSLDRYLQSEKELDRLRKIVEKR